MQYFVK